MTDIQWHDGADLGMACENSMSAALGGEQPRRMVHDEFEEYISAPINIDNYTYDEAGRECAQWVIMYFHAHPRAKRGNADYVWDKIKVSEPAIFTKLQEIDPSGFMWGWAVNAAYHVLGAKPVQNPALIVI